MQLFAPKRGFIGVDAGSACIKIAQLVRRAGSLVLESAHVFERATLSGDSTRARTGSVDEHHLREALRCCDRLSGRRAVATLPMSDCEYNCEPIQPNFAEAEVAQRSRKLVTRQTQLTGQLQHDYWVSNSQIGRSKDGATLHALSTPVALAESVAAGHRAAGYKCEAIDGLPTSLASALTVAGYSSNQPIAAIDWGYSRVTYCIVQQGAPMFVRCFRRGHFGALVDSLIGELHVSHREAREILRTIGLPQSGPAPTRSEKAVGDACIAALSDFDEELDRTLSFLRQRQRDLFPERIVLLGGGATIGHVAAHVSRLAEMDAEAWSFANVGPGLSSSLRQTMPLLGSAVASSARAWEAV